MTRPAEKIIVALDVASEDEALRLVEQLTPDITFFKVGLQLYTATGSKVVRRLRELGANVFLDLKLHDIPNTVAGAVSAANDLDVQMLTIHLSGGIDMVEAAVKARRPGMTLLGVTVLTSINDATLRDVGVADQTASHALRLAKLGAGAGIDGLVASSHELEILREQFGTGMQIVVPGIRPGLLEAADQKRVMTPRQALEGGADYLVIGRPITGHEKPRDAVADILQEIER